MRTAVPSLALLLLAGCQEERSFDQRYRDAASSIQNQANDIDADLAVEPDNSSCQAGDEMNCE